MIHIIHTPAAVLARRREQLMWRCFAAVLLMAAGGAWLAGKALLPLVAYSHDCNFTGVVFVPEESPTEKEAEPLRPRPAAPAAAVGQPVLPLPPALAEAELPLVPLPELLAEADEPTEISPFDTPEDTLETAPAAPATRRAHAPAHVAASKAPEAAEDYSPPAYRKCPHPPFPAALRQRRIQGEVGVLIAVSAAGLPTAVEITQSSGHAALDKHARTWILRHWEFTPATRNGLAMNAQVSTRIHFNLQ